MADKFVSFLVINLTVKKKSFASSCNKALCWHKQIQGSLVCSVECAVHVGLFNQLLLTCSETSCAMNSQPNEM